MFQEPRRAFAVCGVRMMMRAMDEWFEVIPVSLDRAFFGTDLFRALSLASRPEQAHEFYMLFCSV